jgi:glycosyltransferase involved in cell wall biosynthesis
MISFIIPAHNEERWIRKCLDSIRATMEKVAEGYEVIVVDDASTDSTGQIAKQMGLAPCGSSTANLRGAQRRRARRVWGAVLLCGCGHAGE